MHQAHVGAGAAHVEGDRRRGSRTRPPRPHPLAPRPPAPTAGARPAVRRAVGASSSPPADVMTDDVVGQRRRAGRGTRGNRAADRRSPPWSRCARTRGTRARSRGTRRRRGPGHRSAAATRLLVASGRGRRGGGTPPRTRHRRGAAGSGRGRRAPARTRRHARRPATSNRSARGTSGRRAVGPLVVQARSVLAADLDHVGQALGGHQRDRGQPALEHGVGGHRRPVGQQADPIAGRQVLEPDGDCLVGRVRRGQHLHHAPVPSTRSEKVPPVSAPICIVTKGTGFPRRTDPWVRLSAVARRWQRGRGRSPDRDVERATEHDADRAPAGASEGPRHDDSDEQDDVAARIEAVTSTYTNPPSADELRAAFRRKPATETEQPAPRTDDFNSPLLRRVAVLGHLRRRALGRG